MNIEALNKFKNNLDEEVIVALRSLLAAKAFLETIKPVSEKIQAEAFAIYKPVCVPIYINGELHKKLSKNAGEPIEHWNRLYRASDEIAHKMYAFHKAELAKQGFNAEGQKCPFLVAESLVRVAEGVLIDIMEKYTGITEKSLLLSEHRESYIELLLGMLVTVASEQGYELNTLKLAD